MRKELLLALLGLFLACNAFGQVADKIYFKNKIEIGQIIPPFNVLSLELEMVDVAGEQKKWLVADIDSVYKDATWYFNLSSLDPTNDLKVKLAKRFFLGDYSLFKSSDEFGKPKFFLFIESKVILLTEQNYQTVFAEQFGVSSFDMTTLSKADLTKASITYHKQNDLKVKDFVFKRKSRPLAFGIGASMVFAEMNSQPLVSEYQASVRIKAFVNFKFRRSQFSVGYSHGKIRFSTLEIATPNGPLQIEEGEIAVNGATIHYDYFLNNAKVVPFVRVGMLLSKPELSGDVGLFDFKYDSRALPFLGMGLKITDLPALMLHYNYRFKGGSYFYSGGETFTEINQTFGLEISF
ncbi:MAG: hypothetical protein RIC03_02625 [Cyclobacteriaceae bacterium]